MQDRHDTKIVLRAIGHTLLFALALVLAAIMLYGFWLCGFVGLLLDNTALKVGAVLLAVLQAYFIYYRLKGRAKCK